MISKRLAVLSFAAIQSSAITLTNLIFDLASSKSAPAFLEHMRTEVLAELSASHGLFTKNNLHRMTSLDSSLRESMRLWGFVSRGVLKMVVKSGGVRLPGGMWLSQNTTVGIHAYPVHHDEEIYPEPYNFDALRWCRNETEDELSAEDSKNIARGEVKRKGTSLVTTSPIFMAFSHGKHSWYTAHQPPFLCRI
jgi:cytochrome P450